MTEAFNYSTQFILDKSYYCECFDESVTQKVTLKTYLKALIFVLIGLALLLTAANNYASWFIIALGILEALSIKFKRTWWLLRQMWSRAADNPVTLTINEQGIHTFSDYIDSKILWDQIYDLKETKQGFLIRLEKSQTYLSKGYLNTVAIDFIRNNTNQNK